MKFALRLACVTAFSLFTVTAEEWSQYRGPRHDGISTEKISKWAESGPKLLWKTPAKNGFSSFAVAEGIAATLMTREKDGAALEFCVALDANSGKELWAAPLRAVAKYQGGGDDGTPENKGGDGPRSTPAINSGHVYVFDNKLNLYCFDAKSGKEIWSRDFVAEQGGKNISWQNAASPIIEGDLIYVACGGAESLNAINKKDGKTVWKGESDAITHASPTIGTILGQKQVIFFTQKGLVSCEPMTGKVLWRHPFKYSVSTAASPVIAGDIVYCAAGYGVGSSAAKVTKDGETWKAEEIWRNNGNKIANHWSTPIYKDGYLYGMFQFKEHGTGNLKCVDLKTGAEVWAQAGFGPGNVTLVGDKLVALTDAGQVVLIQPSADKYTELGRFKAANGKCWSTPSISDGRIYVRSTAEGACYEVGGRVAQR